MRKKGIVVDGENNQKMTDSYVMIDPWGRFYQNTEGTYKRSEPILKIGLEKAFDQVSLDFEKFQSRNGHD